MEDYYLKLKKQSNELFKVSIAAIILHIGYGYLGTFFYLHKKISEIKLFTLISSSVIIAFLIIVAIINFAYFFVSWVFNRKCFIASEKLYNESIKIFSSGTYYNLFRMYIHASKFF